ncbi:MAG: tRNA lysidine(34) synthetase TilS [Pseudomonadota bacterium]
MSAAGSSGTDARTLAADLADLVAREMALAPPGAVGLAVSGGGDSMALLSLVEEWADMAGRALAVVTVDHGLRPESAAEAELVATRCAQLGLSHDTLAWEGWDGRGNLPEAAREARRRLIGNWAQARGILAVALAHTADDQAETLLLRLARGSGIGGLSAMTAVSAADEIVWMRPLLSARRADLRALLHRKGWGWAEDPTNDDASFDRVKARNMLATLAPLGLTVDRLCQTARHMADARDVLDSAEAALARDAVTLTTLGEARLARPAFLAAPRATAMQLLADLLCVIGGAVHPPRLEALERLAMRLTDGGSAVSLHGCMVRPRGDRVILRREPARCAAPVPAHQAVWDRRWRLRGPQADGVTEGLEIGALGLDGLAALPAKPDAPAELLASTPALRHLGTLIAAPCAGWPQGWVAERIIPDTRRRRFFDGL